jgi:hypothetical protein
MGDGNRGTRSAARAWAFVSCLVFASLLSGCDATGPAPSELELSSDSASQFEVVRISNVGSPEDSEVVVGGQRVPLLYDELSEDHGFMVPPGVEGAVDVVVGASSAAGEARLSLNVRPVAFAGGSPGAAEALLMEGVGLLEGELGAVAGPGSPSAVDSMLVDALHGVGAVAAAFQAEYDRLGPEDREVVLGLYSSNRAIFDRVIDETRARAAEFESSPPLNPTASASPAPDPVVPSPRLLGAVPTIEEVSSECIQSNLDLDAITDLAEANGRFAVIAGAVALLVRSPAAARIGLLLAMMDTSLQAAVVLEGALPSFVHPQGLRVQASPTEVPDDGSGGEMTAYVRRASASGLIGETVDLGASLYDFRRAFEGLRDHGLPGYRELIEVLVGAGLVAYAEELGDLYDRLYELYGVDPSAVRGGYQQVAFDGITFTGSDTGLGEYWQFTTPASGATRQFASMQRLPDGEDLRPVSFGLTGGRGENCSATGELPDSFEGVNGFVLRSAPAGPPSGETSVTRVDVSFRASDTGDFDLCYTNIEGLVVMEGTVQYANADLLKDTGDVGTPAIGVGYRTDGRDLFVASVDNVARDDYAVFREETIFRPGEIGQMFAFINGDPQNGTLSFKSCHFASFSGLVDYYNPDNDQFVVGIQNSVPQGTPGGGGFVFEFDADFVLQE